MNRNTYLGIAICAIGLFALPQVVSIYTGAHTWNDPKDDFRCEKCHQGVFDELRAQVYTTHTPHAFQDEYGTTLYFSCLECHTMEYDVKELYANNTMTPGTGHAVNTSECLDCHGETSGYGDAMHELAERYGMEFTYAHINNPDGYCHKCHDIEITPDGMDFTHQSFITNIDMELMGDAHSGFYTDVVNQTGNANKACLTCHSDVPLDIEWSGDESINMTVNESGTYIIG